MIVKNRFFILFYFYISFIFSTPLQAVDFSPYSIQGKRGGLYMWR